VCVCVCVCVLFWCFLLLCIFEEAGFAQNAIIVITQKNSVTVCCCWFLTVSTSWISLCLVVTWNHFLVALLMNLKSMVYFITLL